MENGRVLLGYGKGRFGIRMKRIQTLRDDLG